MKKHLAIILALFLSVSALAQGTIRGTVADGVNGDLLIGANVLIQGTTKGAMADLDGNYALEGLSAGTYTIAASFISYNKLVEENIVVKDGEVTIVNFNLMPATFIIEQEAVIEVKQDRSKDIFMENAKKKDPAMIDYISSQQIKKSGDSDASSALKRVTGVSTVGNYVFVRGLSDRYIKTTLNGAEIPSLDPKRNSVQMDLFPTALIDNLVVVKTLNSNLPADYSGAFINIITKDFPDKFTFNYSGSLGYNTNATFNNNFLTSAGSDTAWMGWDNGFRDVPEVVSSDSEINQPSLSNYYDALVLAGYESDLNAIGINGPTDIGTGSGQQSIGQIVNQIDGIQSVSQVNNEFLPAIREAQNQGLSEQTKAFGNTWENQRSAAFMDISQAISFGNQTKLFGRPLGYNFGFQYKRSSQFYENGTTGRFTLTGNENEKDNLDVQRLLTDSRGTQSVYTSALFNLSYKLTDNNKIGFTYMPNISGVNDSRYQNGINPSDAVGLGQEQRQQRYLERSMNVFQLRGEHFLKDFHNMKVNWIGSYTRGRQTTPDLRVFTNSYEELPARTLYFDASGNDVTDNVEFLLSEGESIEEAYPGYTTEERAAGELEYSIEDNLYPSPTRYYRDMVDNTLDLKLNFEMPFHNATGLKNTFSFGGSYVGKTRDYSESRYSFISSGLAYAGDPNAYFDASNMNIVPGSSEYLYLRDDTDIQNSYTASQDVLGAYAMVDWNASKKLRINGGLRVETTDMLLESAKLFTDDIDPSLEDNFRGSLDLVDILPAMNLTYQLRKVDLQTTNLRFSASQSVARPMFREKAPYSVFDFEIQEQQTGNTDLTRTLINNLDLRLEHYPNLGEIYSVSFFYKDFRDPIEQVIIATAANTEITWVNVDRAQVFGAEFEVRKNLGALTPKLSNLSAALNVTLVYSATDIQEDELTEIRGTDPNHADTRPMYGQSPYIINSLLSYDNDSLGLNVTASFNISGPQLILITPGGTPDVYDQPRGILDLTVSKDLGEHFAVSFKARNLLDPEYRQTYTFKGEESTFQSFNRGRTFSLGFSYRI